MKVSTSLLFHFFFLSLIFPKNKFLESCIPVFIEVILLAFFLLYGILNYGILIMQLYHKFAPKSYFNCLFFLITGNKVIAV